MKKAFISTVSLALVFAMALSFASCDGDDDVTKDQSTQTNAPQATEKQTEKATDAQTDTPDATETAEDPATDSAVTDAPITNAPATNAPETSNPAKDTTKTPETSEPIEDTTKAPEAEAPAEDPTSPATTKPEEDTKAPATTAPGQDPNVDYSEWGYYGFEALLPAPLPFNDTQWLSRRYAENSYNIMSDKPFKISAEKENIKTLENYVKSLEAFGYTYLEEDYSYLIYDEMGSTFEFSYVDDYVCVSFILVV